MLEHRATRSLLQGYKDSRPGKMQSGKAGSAHTTGPGRFQQRQHKVHVRRSSGRAISRDLLLVVGKTRPTLLSAQITIHQHLGSAKVSIFVEVLATARALCHCQFVQWNDRGWMQCSALSSNNSQSKHKPLIPDVKWGRADAAEPPPKPLRICLTGVATCICTRPKYKAMRTR